ncbi:MAG: hypothetical protein KOO62_08525 [candidate division Zixibacteria bacterium]|nr:hypothetical protein [candidate division Zixibacteria bacterium]
MQQEITTTTAANGLGYPSGRKLLRVESGQYTGRQVVLIQTAAGEIKYSYADAPYSSWSSLTTIATDTADEPFDCVMMSDSDIHIVYSETSTNYLVTRKLDFGGGVWSIGLKVTIYSGTSLYPSVAVEVDGKLWVAFAKVTGGVKTLYVKSSTDSGATWGSGPSDNGTVLTDGASSVFPKTIIAAGDIHVIYSEAAAKIAIRSLPIAGGSWSSEVVIATGTVLDQHYDAALAVDGRLGVVWDNNELKFREHDGAAWGAVSSLDADSGSSPQLKYSNNIPVVTFLSAFASDQKIIMYTTRHTGSFSTPEPLDARAKELNTVLAYESSSASYEDLTSVAASATTGDVYHSGSGKLLNASGDSLFLGMDRKFRFLKLLLSTAGAGGTVVYSYWNGSNWIAFTPAGGGFDFDATDKDLLLWDDFNDVPHDWQKLLLYENNRFWIRVEVNSVFTTSPVGSQLTAISDLQILVARR